MTLRGCMIVIALCIVTACRSPRQQCEDKVYAEQWFPYCEYTVGAASLPKSAASQVIDDVFLLYCVNYLSERERCNSKSTIPEFEPLQQ